MQIIVRRSVKFKMRLNVYSKVDRTYIDRVHGARVAMRFSEFP